MKYTLTLLSASLSLAHGARYGLLRVGTPSVEMSKSAPFTSHRALFDEVEDSHAVFRELFGYVDLSLSFSLSFSMPIELSFSMPNSRPSPIASGPFTLAPVAAPITPSSPGETDETEPNEDSKASESGVQEAQTASLRKINVGNSAETAMIVVLVAAVVAVLAAAAVRKRSQLKFKAQTSADSEVSSLQSSSANGDMVHAGDGMPMI